MTRYEEVRALVKDESLKIKDIAQQTGYDKGHVSRLRKESKLQKLIADAVAAEREACALVCEERQEVFQKYYTKGLAAMCAEAIRARGSP
ncbi:MAG: hypothetical protein ACO3FP_07300 [Burkholderiales bacterium]